MTPQRKKLVLKSSGAVVCVAVLAAAWLIWHRVDNTDILKIAYSFPDGGGYCALSDSGVSEDVFFDGVTILPKSAGGTYCSGFTFQVAMRGAQERGLLDGVEAYQIKRFQREWYGATPESRLKQHVTAMENLRIGYEVDWEDAKPGDFMSFSREKTGHSVVFLGWVKHDDGTIAGLKYRSSQPPGGIGDRTEYLMSDKFFVGHVNPKYLFVGRLKG